MEEVMHLRTDDWSLGLSGLLLIATFATLVETVAKNRTHKILDHIYVMGGGIPLAIVTTIPLLYAGYLSWTHEVWFSHVEHILHFPVIGFLIPVFIFFAILEIREDQHGFNKNHLIITVAGMAGPMLLYLLFHLRFGVSIYGAIVVVATDIVFARSLLQFMRVKKQGLNFATKVAVGDDVGGLILLLVVQAFLLLTSGGEVGAIFMSLFILASGITASAVITKQLNRANAPLPTYLLPAAISWMGFVFSAQEPILGFAIVGVLIDKKHIHGLHRILVWALFPILAAFGFVTGRMDVGTWNILSTAIFVSMIGGKILSIGITSAILIKSGQSVGVNIREASQVAMMMAVGFKVAIVNATVVFRGPELDAAMIAANATIFFGLTVVGLYWLHQSIPAAITKMRQWQAMPQPLDLE